MNRAISMAAAVTAASLLLTACEDPVEPRVPSTIQVVPTSADLVVGDTVDVDATVFDQHGEAFATLPEGVTVELSSSNTAVATVSGTRITAVGEGSATVTVTAGEATPVDIPVSVSPAPTALQGSMSFDFSGDVSGAFEFDEGFDLEDIGREDRTWAVTVFDPEFNSQDIIAWKGNADGTLDIAAFWADGGPVTAPGERPMQEDGFFLIGLDTIANTAETFVEVQAGSIDFTGVSEARLSGTFQGSGFNFFTEGDVTVENGAFDLPLLGASEIRAASVPEGLVEALRAFRRDLR